MQTQDYIELVLAAIGTATAIVAILSSLVVPLRDFAKLTQWTTDDVLVERLAQALAGISWVLLLVGRAVAPLAFKHPLKTFPGPPSKAVVEAVHGKN